jgi:alpha-beta hydrolase superfamily lysophospholipase
VRAAADLARSAGSTDVTCTIYEGMRHEVLNETGHERVYDDVAKWIDDHIGAGRE